MASAVPELSVLARDQAFEILYRRYVKDVYRYALALLRNPADAEDVTQTTFLNAYRAYQRGIEIEKPHNWLIKIAHNVARTRYARASRRVKEVPLDDHVEQLALPEADRPDVTGVLRALGRLPFNQRAALVMRELEGRSYAEIADTMAVSVSAVETLIFRARKSLRLKASSVRALAAVPLPTSLTQFFGGGGGGVIAGGGAGVGTGVLLKVAVAIVAAALGTSVGGDNTRPAAASSRPTTGSAAGAASEGVQGPKVQQAGRLGVRGGAGAAGKSSPGNTATGLTTGLAAVDAVTGQPPAGQGASPTSDTPPATKSHSGLVSQVTTTAADLAAASQQVVASPASALPVQVPSLPAVPTLPPPPSLPAVPALPPPIAVPKVQLPPPPSLPPPPPLPLP
jgi:RNA polymerase sigma factor (sigma-70 family)